MHHPPEMGIRRSATSSSADCTTATNDGCLNEPESNPAVLGFPYFLVRKCSRTCHHSELVHQFEIRSTSPFDLCGSVWKNTFDPWAAPNFGSVGHARDLQGLHAVFCSP